MFHGLLSSPYSAQGRGGLGIESVVGGCDLSQKGRREFNETNKITNWWWEFRSRAEVLLSSSWSNCNMFVEWLGKPWQWPKCHQGKSLDTPPPHPPSHDISLCYTSFQQTLWELSAWDRDNLWKWEERRVEFLSWKVNSHVVSLISFLHSQT